MRTLKVEMTNRTVVRKMVAVETTSDGNQLTELWILNLEKERSREP